jgi:probable rRNA maturation factor
MIALSGTRLFGEDEKKITAIVKKVFRAAFVDHKRLDVGVTFVLDLEMRALNRRWRKKDKTTDVLSFSAVEGIDDDVDGDGDSDAGFVVGGDVDVLGDLVISVETAARQADEFGHDVDVEVAVLVAHGLMHLCGLDHERGADHAERQLMAEMTVLAEAGLDVTRALAARA